MLINIKILVAHECELHQETKTWTVKPGVTGGVGGGGDYYNYYYKSDGTDC